MRRAEDDLLERLVGHRPRPRLDAIGVEHVAHARADDSVKLLPRCSSHHLEPRVGADSSRSVTRASRLRSSRIARAVSASACRRLSTTRKVIRTLSPSAGSAWAMASRAICSGAVPRDRFAEGGGTRLATASLLQSIEGRLYE